MTKINTTTVIAFVALLMVMPLASSNAFAVSHEDTDIVGTANIDSVCSISVGDDISFGVISPGQDSIDQSVVIDTSGSTIGGFQVTAQASDWLGDAVPAQGTITISDPKIGDSVSLDGVTYTGIAEEATPIIPTVTDAEFNISSSESSLEANNLATAVNLGVVIDEINTSVSMQARTTNVITLVAVIAGPDGNNIALTSGQNTIGVSGTGTLQGGALGQVHLAAEVTKFAIDVTSTVNPNVVYADKLAMATSSVELTNEASPASNIGLHLQISTANGELQHMPYTGKITQQITFTLDCGQ